MSAAFVASAIASHNRNVEAYAALGLDAPAPIPVPHAETPRVPARPFVGSYERLRNHAADRQRLRGLIDGTGPGACTECGWVCEPGEFLCDDCAAEEEAALATVECNGCAAEVPAAELDGDGECPECRTLALELERAAEFRADD